MAEPIAEVAFDTDVGEGFGAWELGDDDALLGVVTAANVACGFHAGDPDILRRTCDRAAELGVSIGAQVSYRDLAGFGRRYIAVPPASLVNDLLYQIGALEAFARVAGTRVSYVKPHGALYNVAARDAEHAGAIVAAVAAYDRSLPLLCQPATEVWRLATGAGVRPVAEAFVDRGYTVEGLLVPRGQPGALVTDPAGAAARAVRMVVESRVESVDGVDVELVPEALCVHSDTPGAVEIARAVRGALEAIGVRLVPVS